jgi:TM2 domain-containing membrane protein YozV
MTEPQNSSGSDQPSYEPPSYGTEPPSYAYEQPNPGNPYGTPPVQDQYVPPPPFDPYGAPPPNYGAPPGYGQPPGAYPPPAPGFGAPPPPYGNNPYPQPGAPFGVDPYGRPLSDKSKLTAGLLQLFLGGFGVGRFYLGYSTIGVLQLVVTLVTCGFGAIWGLIDAIMILTDKVPDAQGRGLRD